MTNLMTRSQLAFATVVLSTLITQLVAQGIAADWKAELDERIAGIRQGDARIKIVDGTGKPVPGISVTIQQTRNAFAFGAAMSGALLRDSEYGPFFKDHFNFAVFENDAKWYSNERFQGRTDYRTADAMLEWCEANQIPVRGHCLFWEPEKWQPRWAGELSDNALKEAVEQRLESAIKHFQGRFVHWDVNNEMLHGSFYKDRLGDTIWPWMFQRAHELDPEARLFVNEFNILSVDQNFDAVQTDEYVESIRQLLKQGAPIHGIGIQGHIWHEDILADLSALQERLDKVATLGLPIWISEFDVADDDETRCADILELVYRTAFGHPSVEGIMMWVFWAGNSWRGANAGLANRDWTLKEAGKRYESLMKEWCTTASGVSDENGFFSFRGFHGHYTASASNENGDPVVIDFSIEKSRPLTEATIHVETFKQ